ncbi:Uncharacterized membrane protein [Halopseudomonas xinjiangensis]|uniref:Uncharacterized membrane protein n=1 Tax=Halopseudomonas xinjiangensis TaxID=487184 RepID=A0A1H1SSI3_9GAMM|nr:PACE efflux transporter [Halopseudomonas xinjiangensis]SDS50942.1 Uncharacterized membrane protein [Halopseudomonas xinjiangensis]
MQGPKRKVFQALLYEALAVFFISPAFAYSYNSDLAHSTTLSIIISLIAVAWNMAYNYSFERWEDKQEQHRRTFSRRVVHSVGFEGGLTVMLLPLLSYWLHISLLEALMANMALFAFFFLYAFIFQWAFDKVFGAPLSAKAIEATDAPPG